MIASNYIDPLRFTGLLRTQNAIRPDTNSHQQYQCIYVELLVEGASALQVLLLICKGEQCPSLSITSDPVNHVVWTRSITSYGPGQSRGPCQSRRMGRPAAWSRVEWTAAPQRAIFSKELEHLLVRMVSLHDIEPCQARLVLCDELGHVPAHHLLQSVQVAGSAYRFVGSESLPLPRLPRAPLRVVCRLSRFQSWCIASPISSPRLRQPWSGL